MNRTLRLFLLVQPLIFALGALGCGDEESETECEKAYNIRMEAIQGKCAEVNLQGCCYCNCELNLALPPDCVCDPNALTSNTDISTCDDIAVGQAMDCTGNPAGCAEKMKSIVALRCPIQ